jgi:hypothetical protein
VAVLEDGLGEVARAGVGAACAAGAVEVVEFAAEAVSLGAEAVEVAAVVRGEFGPEPGGVGEIRGESLGSRAGVGDDFVDLGGELGDRGGDKAQAIDEGLAAAQNLVEGVVVGAIDGVVLANGERGEISQDLGLLADEDVDVVGGVCGGVEGNGHP